MKRLLLIGIGPGDPDYLTIQAIKALNRVDVFFFLEKEGAGKDELLRIRRDILERYATERPYRIVTAKSPVRHTAPADAGGRYRAGVAAWHREKGALLAELVRERMTDGECGALLLWGDPALYDSTLTLLLQLGDALGEAFDYELIPGITSIQALTAKHRITLNRVGEEVRITTARRLAERGAADIHNDVVMLDSNAAFRQLATSDLSIYWGAYLGTDDEMLVAGRLRDVADEIAERIRRAKAEKGWIMDVYLLRDQDPPR